MRIKSGQKYFVLYNGKNDRIVSKVMYGKELVDISPKKVIMASKFEGK